MSGRKWFAVATLVLAGWACDPPAETVPATSAAPVSTASSAPKTASAASATPAAGAQSGLPKRIINKIGERNLVTLARPLLGRATAADGLRLVLTWRDGKKGPLTSDHPLGAQKIDWAKTAQSLRAEIHPPGGEALSLEVQPKEGLSRKLDMSLRPSVALRLDAQGVKLHLGSEVWAWKDPPARLFAKAGNYRLRLSGSLVFDEGPIAFEIGDLVYDVAKPSAGFKPVAELERIAAGELQKREELEDEPRPAKETIADVARNRLVRFAIDSSSGGDEVLFSEVVMSPGGAVLAVESRKVVTRNESSPTRAGALVQSGGWAGMFIRPRTLETGN